jgi:toxin-antitoxin system PIN domain toxin
VRALFDVSALLAVFDGDHMFHTVIRTWWAANERAGWATCPLTQNGLVRIMSQPAYPRHRAAVEIVTALRTGVAQPGHQFWPDDNSIADTDAFDHARILGPSQVTDLYLLALAVKNNGRLVTFDRGIPLSAVRRAEARHLVII